MGRRIDVEANDILELLGELGIACQRQITVLPLPTARITAVVPSLSAVRTMIRALP